MKRIVSLIPSSTEIVCALGCGEQLVGCSHECDFPHFVKSLPTLTESKFDSEGTSYEIDQRVKAIVQDALSVYRVDVEQLERLQPNVILTQNQCEVCAVSLKDLEEAIKLFTGKSSPTIVSLEPNGLEDIWSDIRRVARALDAEEQANKLLENLQDRIEKIADKISQATVQPTVVCIEWIEPLMVAGNWVPTLVKLAGESTSSERKTSMPRGQPGKSFKKQTLTLLSPCLAATISKKHGVKCYP